MNLSQEEYEYIGYYLKGRLAADETLVFERRMKEDPSLAEKVAMEKMLNAVIVEKSLADIRRKVGEDLSPPTGAGKSAVVMVLLGGMVAAGLVFYLYRVCPKDKPQKGQEAMTTSGKVKTPRGPSAHVQALDTLRANVVAGPPASKQASKPSVSSSNKASQSQDGDASTLIRDVKEAEHLASQGTVATAHQEFSRENSKKVEELSKRHSSYGSGKEVPCNLITFETKVEASCAHSPTGRIQIVPSGVYGGKEPYTYKIDEEPFGNVATYTDLAAGMHKATVKDSKGCFTEKTVTVNEKPCVEYKDYAFHAETESWKLPVKDGESGTLTITNSGGHVLYHAKIVNGRPDEWNGRSNTGELLHTGSYLYILIVDGGEIRQGYILLLH